MEGKDKQASSPADGKTLGRVRWHSYFLALYDRARGLRIKMAAIGNLPTGEALAVVWAELRYAG